MASPRRFAFSDSGSAHSQTKWIHLPEDHLTSNLKDTSAQRVCNVTMSTQWHCQSNVLIIATSPGKTDPASAWQLRYLVVIVILLAKLLETNWTLVSWYIIQYFWLSRSLLIRSHANIRGPERLESTQKFAPLIQQLASQSFCETSVKTQTHKHKTRGETVHNFVLLVVN